MDVSRKRIALGGVLIALVAAGILIPLALMPAQSPIQVELTELSSIDTGGWANAVIVENDIAYVTDIAEPTPGGIVIIDVSNPSNPVEIGSFDDELYPTKLDIEDNILFVADHFGALRLIDVSDPTDPVQVGEFEGSGETMDVQVEGDIAYVADWTQGVYILNVSDPTNPEELGHYQIYGACTQLYVSNELIYAIDHRNDNTGLKVLNASDPEHPFLIESYMPTDEDLWNPIVVGDYIYTGNHGGGGGELQILDTSDPTNISRIGVFDNGCSINTVFVTDGIAYTADYDSGLFLIDIRDPYNPTYITTLEGHSSGRDVVVVDDLVFLTKDGGGLTIIQVNQLS
jgi:hypothetical protein